MDKTTSYKSSSTSSRRYKHPNSGVPSSNRADEISTNDAPSSSDSITNSEVLNDYFITSAKSQNKSINASKYSRGSYSNKVSDNSFRNKNNYNYNNNHSSYNNGNGNRDKSNTTIESKHNQPDNNPRSKEEELKAIQRAKRFSNQSAPVNANSYGFVSRGEDNRLQKSHRDRQKFFNMILLTFIEYCNLNSTHSLSKNFSKLVNKNDVLEDDADEEKDHKKKNEISLDSILSSLRKLREALLYIDHSKNGGSTSIKTKEIEQFTAKVYLFSIRLSANIGHYQTYIPSINHLILHKSLLNDDEFEEISILLILHLLHFNNLQSKAIKIYYDNELHKRKTSGTIKLWQVLQSWIHQDYVQWLKLFNSEKDTCKLTIMKFGYDKIMKHMINVINQSYFTILERDLYNDLLQQEFLKTKCDINDIIVKYKLNWKVEEGKDSNRLVIIKERRTVKSS
ncbi:hypothetical protein DFJ63DRAFT_71563 [Scheffersomyces coipomensis]|uniref:uncharacterized protein n=1 Tax=Scheffersomyces coipomensis TaxID=1788519 RepID=UPI00315D956F